MRIIFVLALVLGVQISRSVGKTFRLSGHPSSCVDEGSQWTNAAYATSTSTVVYASWSKFSIGPAALNCSVFDAFTALPSSMYSSEITIDAQRQGLMTSHNSYTISRQVRLGSDVLLDPSTISLSAIPKYDSFTYEETPQDSQEIIKWLALAPSISSFPSASVLFQFINAPQSISPSLRIYNVTMAVAYVLYQCDSPECVISQQGCVDYLCACDDGYNRVASGLGCNPICGDDLLVPDESCELGYMGCISGCVCNATAGFYPGNPVSKSCVAQCQDGIWARGSSEECDQSPHCLSDCKCDPLAGFPSDANGNCKPYCGDGIVAPGTSERCDGGEGCSPTTCTCESNYEPFEPYRVYCAPACMSGEVWNGTDCKVCPDGYEVQAKQCEQCPTGMYSNSSTNLVCAACPTGYRTDLPGAGSCTPIVSCEVDVCKLGCQLNPTSCSVFINETVSVSGNTTGATRLEVSGQVVLSGNLSVSGLKLVITPGSDVSISGCLTATGNSTIELVLDGSRQLPANGTILLDYDSSCSEISTFQVSSTSIDRCTVGTPTLVESAQTESSTRGGLQLLFTTPSDCSSNSSDSGPTVNVLAIAVSVSVVGIVVIAVAIILGVPSIRTRMFPYRREEEMQKRLSTIH